MWMLNIIVKFSLWFIAGVARRLESNMDRLGNITKKYSNSCNSYHLPRIHVQQKYEVPFNLLNKHHSSCKARAIDLNSRAAKRLPYSLRHGDGCIYHVNKIWCGSLNKAIIFHQYCASDVHILKIDLAAHREYQTVQTLEMKFIERRLLSVYIN